MANTEMTAEQVHLIGDTIHVQFFFKDGRCTMSHYGNVVGARLSKGSFFPDRVLYDLELEQADAPGIFIQNCPAGFILAGSPNVPDEEPEQQETA